MPYTTLWDGDHCNTSNWYACVVWAWRYVGPTRLLSLGPCVQLWGFCSEPLFYALHVWARVLVGFCGGGDGFYWLKAFYDCEPILFHHTVPLHLMLTILHGRNVLQSLSSICTYMLKIILLVINNVAVRLCDICSMVLVLWFCAWDCTHMSPSPFQNGCPIGKH